MLAAAQQALLLEEPQQLAELLDQWGASDFSALPAVGTLSSQDIAGARGAYVEDLSQIFLNRELAEASDQEISAVRPKNLVIILMPFSMTSIHRVMKVSSSPPFLAALHRFVPVGP